MKPDLIVALDVPASADIAPLVHRLGHSVSYYKVGLELFCAGGPEVLLPLQMAGKQVFLDLKLHDIPRTVARAVTTASRHGVQWLTLHAAGGRAMLREAAAAARDLGPSAPRLLAVTLLTSLDARDLEDLGVSRTPADQVLRLAEMAVACGIDGVVASPSETAALRRALGPHPLLVIPGIRPAGAAAGDQKRVGTPADAVRAGASFLVVGRPILEASDPAAAARAIRVEMDAAPDGPGGAGP
jgi:orotidine-5'-phosphate decarboxylase